MTRRDALKGLSFIAAAPWKAITKPTCVAVRNPAYDAAEYCIYQDPNPFGKFEVGIPFKESDYAGKWTWKES